VRIGLDIDGVMYMWDKTARYMLRDVLPNVATSTHQYTNVLIDVDLASGTAQSEAYCLNVSVFADPAAHGEPVAGDVQTEHPSASRRGPDQAEQEPHGGALAGAVRPEEAEDLAAPHLEVELEQPATGSVVLAQPLRDERRTGAHSGMLPCLRFGPGSRFVSMASRARIRYGRVRRGSITSSTYPRSAAEYGLAKRSL